MPVQHGTEWAMSKPASTDAIGEIKCKKGSERRKGAEHRRSRGASESIVARKTEG